MIVLLLLIIICLLPGGIEFLLSLSLLAALGIAFIALVAEVASNGGEWLFLGAGVLGVGFWIWAGARNEKDDARVQREKVAKVTYYTAANGRTHRVPDEWSFDHWQTWDRCPTQYRYRFIENASVQNNLELERDGRIHKSLARYLISSCNDLLPPEVTDPNQRQLYAEMQAHQRKQVEQKWGFSRNWRECGWTGSHTWVRAISDVVLFYNEDDIVEVVDHKTGERCGSNDDQVELFALTAFERFGIAAKNGVKTRLIYIDSDQQHEAFFLGSDMDRIREKWTLRADKMLADRKWIPRPSDNCRDCPFGLSKGGPCLSEQSQSSMKAA